MAMAMVRRSGGARVEAVRDRRKAVRLLQAREGEERARRTRVAVGGSSPSFQVN
jgi:hypothetical protein